MTGDMKKSMPRTKVRYRIKQMENLFEFTACMLNTDLAYSVIDYA